MSSSNKSIVTIGIGNCGIQITKELFKQYCVEYEIDKSGQANDEILDSKFFYKIGNDRNYRSNAIFIDSDQSTLDKVVNSSHSELFVDSCVRFDHFSCAYKYRTAENKYTEQMMNKLQSLIEKSDNLDGFMIPHSMGGSVGSGVTCLSLQNIRDQYTKSQIHTFSLFPTQKEFINSDITLYNSILSFSTCHQYQDLCLVFDNKKLRDITQKYLRSYLMSLNNFDTINEYMSKTISAYTSNMRYEGTFNASLTDIQTNLVPIPPMHYCLSTYAPIIPRKDVIETYDMKNDKLSLVVNGFIRNSFVKGIASEINQIISERYNDYFQFETNIMDLSLINLTLQLFKTETFPIGIDYTNAGKWMAVCLNFRGNIVPKDIEAVTVVIKTKREIQFVDWCPTGFKVGVVYAPPIIRKDTKCIMDATDKEVSLVGNVESVMWYIEQIVYWYAELMKEKNCNRVKHVCDTQGVEQSELNEMWEKIQAMSIYYNDCFGPYSLESDGSDEWEDESEY